MQPHPLALLADLDRRFFEENYLPAAFARDVLEANDRSYEQRLASTKMIAAASEPLPTILGLLVLGNRTRDFIPGAYIQFLRIAGTELGQPIIDELIVDGAITDVLRRIDDKMKTHNRTAVDLTSEVTEQRRQPYPLPALQQLVRNAVMHCTYEATNAPIRVTWYDDRIEIVNPGGPYGIVNAANFGEPGLTDYRNPNLAESLRVLGFVQRYGVGIPTARRVLRENGNPPLEFDIQPMLVGIIVRSAP
jgi:ATP-dependent DNA helicase RecG